MQPNPNHELAEVFEAASQMLCACGEEHYTQAEATFRAARLFRDVSQELKSTNPDFQLIASSFCAGVKEAGKSAEYDQARRAAKAEFELRLAKMVTNLFGLEGQGA